MTTEIHPWQRLILWGMGWLERYRYLKFGIVGASGTVVNLAVLYVAHEYLFSAIEPTGSKPYFSLALAIALATVNNFTWNRLWTWADRVAAHHDALHEDASHLALLARHFGKYALASWFGMALQYGLTLWITHWLHYLVDNLISIVAVSVINFLANDRWTFRRR